MINGFSVVDADLISRFENAYEGLETYLKKSHYIAGDDLTLADFSVVTTVSSMNVCIFFTLILYLLASVAQGVESIYFFSYFIL